MTLCVFARAKLSRNFAKTSAKCELSRRNDGGHCGEISCDVRRYTRRSETFGR